MNIHCFSTQIFPINDSTIKQITSIVLNCYLVWSTSEHFLVQIEKIDKTSQFRLTVQFWWKISTLGSEEKTFNLFFQIDSELKFATWSNQNRKTDYKFLVLIQGLAWTNTKLYVHFYISLEWEIYALEVNVVLCFAIKRVKVMVWICWCDLNSQVVDLWL